MSGFDFRQLLGGGCAAVGHDPHLADGIEKDQAAADMQASKAAAENERAEACAVVIQFIANTLIVNAQARRECPAGMLGLVVAAMGRAYGEAHGPASRQHVIDEVERAIAAMKRGEL